MGRGMSEPSTADKAEDDRSVGDPGPGLLPGKMRDRAATTRERARAAGQALERFGPRVGWGLLALGLLSSFDRGLALAVEGTPTPAAWIKAVVDSTFLILAFGLAGLGAALLCRLLAAWIIELIDRPGPTSDELTTPAAARGGEALGRIIEAL